MSTSENEERAKRFAGEGYTTEEARHPRNLYELRMVQGYDISELSCFPKEEEILIESGACFEELED